MNTQERSILFVTAFGHSVCHINILVFAGILIPISQAFHMTLSEITRIGTLSYFLFGLGAFPAGLLAQKTNARFTLRLFFASSAAASLFIALSNTALGFSIGLALLGAFGSLYHVSGLTLISQGVRRKGKMLGFHGIAGSAGLAIAPILSSVIASLAGWQMVYLFVSLLGLIGFIFTSVNPHIPKAHILTEQKRAQGPIQTPALGTFILLLGIMACNGLVYRGFMTILPTYFAQKIAIGNWSSLITGGAVTTLILSVGMLGQFTGGYLSDKHDSKWLYFITVCCSIPFLFAMGFLNNIPLIAVSVFFALFHFPQQPIENHLIAKMIPSKWISSAYGIKFSTTFGIGAFSTGLVGIIADKWSMVVIYPFLSILVIFAATGLFLFVRGFKADNL